MKNILLSILLALACFPAFATDLYAPLTTRALNSNAATQDARQRLIDNGDGTWSPQVAASVSSSASTVGGASIYYSPALSAVTAIKTSAGTVSLIELQNPNAANSYCQFFDLATTSVTLGSTTPTFVKWIPSMGSASLALPVPLQFNNAITIACTTTATGSTAPATGILVEAIGYK